MKKLITLLLVAVMMFTFAFSACAADVAKGINVHFNEDADGIITAEISAVGLSSMTGLTLSIKYDTAKIVGYLDKNKTTTTSTTYADIVEDSAFAGWGTKAATFKKSNARVTIVRGTDDGVGRDYTTSTTLCKVYFKKVENATIDSATFTANYNKLSDKTYYSDNGAQYTFDNPDNVSFTVTPYVAPAEETWQDTISDTTTGDIKFPTTSDEIGKETITGSEPAKKVVVFAKNTSKNALVGTATGTANYGITVGRSYYPGYLDVPAGSNWCIMLVDPDGSLLNGTYQVSVTVDGVTQTTTARTFGE